MGILPLIIHIQGSVKQYGVLRPFFKNSFFRVSLPTRRASFSIPSLFSGLIVEFTQAILSLPVIDRLGEIFLQSCAGRFSPRISYHLTLDFGTERSLLSPGRGHSPSKIIPGIRPNIPNPQVSSFRGSLYYPLIAHRALLQMILLVNTQPSNVEKFIISPL